MTCKLLERCRALGILLEAEGDRLAIDAPAGALTPELLGEIRANKPTLLAALKPSGDGTATRADGEPVDFLDTWLAGQDLGQWTYADGRLTGPDSSPADDWDSLPDPGEPCPTCNGLDFSVDLLGERHCQRCEPERLARSLKLAAKAERLRQKARTESRPPDAHGNERLQPSPRIDTCLSRTQ